MTTDTHNRALYTVASITEGNRIRRDYGDLTDLADSIREHGLIHPIVINTKGVLIAGGRRFRAMRDILKWTEVPVTFFEFADDATLRILEREENVRRKAMTWQEETLSILEVHQHYSRNAALNSSRWTQRATGELLNQSEASISYALLLGDLIRKGDKDILACAKPWDALQLLTKRRAEESNKILAKLTVPKLSDTQVHDLLSTPLSSDSDIFTVAPAGPSSGGITSLTDDGEMPTGTGAPPPPLVVPLSRMLLHGDSVAILAQMAPDSIDHVITDWPYAIDIDMLDQSNPHGGQKDMDMVRAEHEVDSNMALHAAIVPAIFRVLKPGGFFITWGDYMQWQRTYDLCLSAGFKVQRWPLIWYKTSRCMNQSALYNFTKNHEPAIVCRKGNATLLSPQGSSVFVGSNEAEEKSLGHPFAKPFKLWEWLYSSVAQRGQTVLDPFGGRGSSTIAALNYGLSPIVIESNEAHHSALVINIADWYKKTTPNVTFV